MHQPIIRQPIIDGSQLSFRDEDDKMFWMAWYNCIAWNSNFCGFSMQLSFLIPLLSYLKNSHLHFKFFSYIFKFILLSNRFINFLSR